MCTEVEQAEFNKKVQEELLHMGMGGDDEWHDIFYYAYTTISRLASYHLPTAIHSLRVARMLAIDVWVSGGNWKDVKQAFGGALFHDDGKECVPINILSKPPRQPLTDNEYAIMQTHVTRKAPVVNELDQISRNNKWWRPIALAVMGHHLRPDGRGYGPNGPQIPGQPVNIRKLTMQVHFCDYLDATGRNDREENIGKSEQVLLDEAIENLNSEGFRRSEVERLRYVAEQARRLDIRNAEVVMPKIQQELEKKIFRIYPYNSQS